MRPTATTTTTAGEANDPATATAQGGDSRNDYCGPATATTTTAGANSDSHSNCCPEPATTTATCRGQRRDNDYCGSQQPLQCVLEANSRHSIAAGPTRPQPLQQQEETKHLLQPDNRRADDYCNYDNRRADDYFLSGNRAVTTSANNRRSQRLRRL